MSEGASAVKLSPEALDAMAGKTGDDPEYVQKMVAKADPNAIEDPANGDQGQLIAGKYKTQEDLEKGILELVKKQHGDNLVDYYKSLESGMGKPAQAAGEGDASGGEGDALSQAAGEGEGEGDALSQAAGEGDSKEMDFSKFEAEIEQDGSLSDESYKELADAGYPKDLVDRFIAGQQAVQTQFNQSVKAMAGGEENYTKLTEWAGSNLTKAEINAFNESLDSGDLGKIKMMVDALDARYQKANGNPPANRLEPGNANNSAGGDVFNSMKELSLAQRDPRYNTDPAYRRAVIAKLKRSKL